MDNTSAAPVSTSQGEGRITSSPRVSTSERDSCFYIQVKVGVHPPPHPTQVRAAGEGGNCLGPD